MTLDPDACYRAMLARDRRFDGVFFVAVETTGVYCRPVCPARTPGRRRCRFFARAAEAERAGFRACFRCRPELAPGGAAVDAVPRLVAAAVARIDAGALNDGSVDALAAALGVTGRHLRRAMETALGVSPIELAQTRRLAVAKQLLQDTALPVTDVAFAAGFASVRRFNAAFRGVFGRAPTAVRRAADGDAGPAALVVRLDYRPPLAWDALIGFLGARAVPGVEQIDGGVYRRTVALGGVEGVACVRPDPARPALIAELSPGLAPRVVEIAARLRRLFDLDARPDVVAAHLGRDRRLGALVRRRPGLRVPGAFDGFEVAARAVLGQQVSVAAATTLAGRLVARFGAPVAGSGGGGGGAAAWRRFPTAGELAALEPSAIAAAVGLPAARAATLVALARAAARGDIALDPAAAAAHAPDEQLARLLALPGVGPWTAHYLAMRVGGWPDAFPSGDLVVRRALGAPTARAAEARAAAWRPWRAYAAIHLWAASAAAPLARRSA